LEHILQHDLVERQVRHQALQLRVFVAQLLQLTGFTGQHSAVDLLPAVERLLGDPDLATDISHRDAPGHLLQYRRHLLDRKPFLLHGTPSWPTGRIVPQNSLSEWTEFPGARHRATGARHRTLCLPTTMPTATTARKGSAKSRELKSIGFLQHNLRLRKCRKRADQRSPERDGVPGRLVRIRSGRSGSMEAIERVGEGSSVRSRGRLPR